MKFPDTERRAKSVDTVSIAYWTAVSFGPTMLNVEIDGNLTVNKIEAILRQVPPRPKVAGAPAGDQFPSVRVILGRAVLLMVTPAFLLGFLMGSCGGGAEGAGEGPSKSRAGTAEALTTQQGPTTVITTPESAAMRLTTATPTMAPAATSAGGASEPAGNPAPLNSVQTPSLLTTPLPSQNEFSPTKGSDIVDFVLENITVSAGTTVVWTNRDSVFHTSSSGVPVTLDGLWDSSELSKGDQFSFVFAQEGVFPYWCRIHPNMTGTITVLAPAP